MRTLRRLRRSPGFLAVSTVSLAVGLALSVATFAIVDSILHPKIPIADVDRVFTQRLRLGNQKNPPTAGEQMRALRSLPGIERVGILTAQQKRVLVSGSEHYARVARTSPDLLELFGVRPLLGRMPNAEEIRTGSAVVVTLYTWRSLFGTGGQPGVATLTIDDRIYTVVGVLPVGINRLFGDGIWLPFSTEGESETLRSPQILAKLRPGVDSLSIRPQLATIAAGFTAAYVSASAPPYELQLRGIRPRPTRLQEDAFSMLLVGIAIGVLAIACINVAALALARALTRRRDHALRLALGASRLAIGGEVLAEVAIIALLGAALGIALAVGLLGMFMSIVPEDMTWSGYFLPELNARVFVLTALALTVGIGIAGGIPAWRASRASPADPLKDNAGTTTGRSRAEFRILVIGELAVSMVLLMLASLVTLSTKNIVNYEFGYDARKLLRANVYLPSRGDTMSLAERQQLQLSTLERVRRTPGVLSAAAGTAVLVENEEMIGDDTRDGVPLPMRAYLDVGPGYLATLGIPLLAGRDVAEGDRASGGAVVLTQRAAKALFPRGDAIGRSVKFGDVRSSRPWLPVVGIARDVDMGVRILSPVEAQPLIFASTSEAAFEWWHIAIRPRAPSAALALDIGRTLRDGTPPRASVRVGDWLEGYDSTVRRQTFYERVFSLLGTAALLLGAAGLFSVLSYVVSQRMREFAVRLALGARPRDLQRIVLRSAFEMAIGGTAIGALLSFWASAGISAMLYGVKNTDPVSLVVAETTLLLVTMAASLAPALRASRADPLEVLRAT